jgi:hypothetical protein
MRGVENNMVEHQLDLNLHGNYFALVATSSYDVQQLIDKSAQHINTIDEPTLQSYLNVVTVAALNEDPSINSDEFQNDVLLQVMK